MEAVVKLAAFVLYVLTLCAAGFSAAFAMVTIVNLIAEPHLFGPDHSVRLLLAAAFGIGFFVLSEVALESLRE